MTKSSPSIAELILQLQALHIVQCKQQVYCYCRAYTHSLSAMLHNQLWGHAAGVTDTVKGQNYGCF